VAAQIIHIQNTVCQTIVKEPQNEVWLVECWNCEKTSEQQKVKMKIDELTQVDNKFHKMNPFYGNEYYM
jgi:hypothetical protein